MAAHKKFMSNETNRIQPAKAGRLSGIGGRNGRGASGGKVLNGRTENGNFNGRKGSNKSQRRGDSNINTRGIHLAMREQCDGALMSRRACVRVKAFVQRRRRGQCIEQQNKTGQQ